MADHAGFVGGTGGLGIINNGHRVLVKVRRGRQPTEPLGDHVVIRQVMAAIGSFGGGCQQVVSVEPLVTPLVGVKIEKAGAIHLP